MSWWLYAIGGLGTMIVGVLLGIFLGGLMAASDQKKEERLRAQAVAALIEARPFADLWIGTASIRIDRESPHEFRAKRVVSFAILQALRVLGRIKDEDVPEELQT